MLLLFCAINLCEYRYSILDEAYINFAKNPDMMKLLNIVLCSPVNRCFSKLWTRSSINHPHYTSRALQPGDKSMEHDRDFRIMHYAGDVMWVGEDIFPQALQIPQIFGWFPPEYYNVLQYLPDPSNQTKRPLNPGVNPSRSSVLWIPKETATTIDLIL